MRNKVSSEQVLKIRDLIWNQNYTYDAAAKAAGVEKISWTSLTALARGYSHKTVGGPTGGEGRKPRKRNEAVSEPEISE